MIQAFDAIAASMTSDVSRLATIGHNLANATTPGFRRDIASSEPFHAALQSAGESSTSMVDQRQAALRHTGAALDVAIDGEGFFEVQTAEGLAYTRRGDFRIDTSGHLVTHAGLSVQGVGGPLQLTHGAPVIDRQGRIVEGEKVIGQLKVVTFDKGSALHRRGDGLFSVAGSSTVSDTARVRQGHLEASNVNTASEMVKLIETMRHFEATQKIVQGVDEMTEKALRKLGEF